MKRKNLPPLSEVVKHGRGLRESMERDVARANVRGEKLTRVKGTKLGTIEDDE